MYTNGTAKQLGGGGENRRLDENDYSIVVSHFHMPFLSFALARFHRAEGLESWLGVAGLTAHRAEHRRSPKRRDATSRETVKETLTHEN